MSKWRRHYSLRRRWQRNHLINKYGMVCHICGLPLIKMKDITLDHLVPMSKGGTDELENMRLAHFVCNQTKADLTPEEFAQFQDGVLV